MVRGIAQAPTPMGTNVPVVRKKKLVVFSSVEGDATPRGRHELVVFYGVDYF